MFLMVVGVCLCETPPVHREERALRLYLTGSGRMKFCAGFMAGGSNHDRQQKVGPDEFGRGVCRGPIPTFFHPRLIHPNGVTNSLRAPDRNRLSDDVSALPVSDAHSRPAARRTKVLVAEDHDDTRQMLRTLLERRGLSVVEARNGMEAVDAAERERPDLILMDGSLPLLDGFGATRRLRALPALSAVPIVFLSGHAGPQAQTDALEAGCDEYVVKPFDLAQFDTVLNRHLPGEGGVTQKGFSQSMAQPEIKVGTRFKPASPSLEAAPVRKLYGLFELDSAGTVLYARVEPDGTPRPGAAPDYTGRNFYTEVAPFRNIAEFKNQFDEFKRGAQPAHSMGFTCDYEDGPLLVRVLLARIRERSQADATKSILVHIRRAQ